MQAEENSQCEQTIVLTDFLQVKQLFFSDYMITQNKCIAVKRLALYDNILVNYNFFF